jgi:dysferlin
MPALAKTESKCSLNLLNPDHKKYKTVNLFEQKHVKGWLPVFQEDYQPVQGERREVLGNRTITGKVEIEMEMLTAEEHEARPAAKGRDEPNQHPVLPAPNRPALSFAWYTSPLKTFKHIVWRQYRKRIILGIILFIFFFSFLMLL